MQTAKSDGEAKGKTRELSVMLAGITWVYSFGANDLSDIIGTMLMKSLLQFTGVLQFHIMHIKYY